MAEIVKQLKPIDLDKIQPPLCTTLVVDRAGLARLKDYLQRKAEKREFAIGVDTETNICDDFYYRRVRSIQVGCRDEQYVIDLLAFAGSEEKLIATQGEYGANVAGVYDDIFEVLDPFLCGNQFLKVGQNLSFEYGVFRWNFGRRIWHLYSTDIAERVIQAGNIPLKRMTEFSMASIAGRYFGLLIDKTEQEGFDLKTPLTPKQIQYAAFDVRFPHAMRQAQTNIMTRDQLLATSMIENDAIGSYTDMHLNGQNLDDERWIARIKNVVERRKGELKVLDEGFLPYVGNKNNQIDIAELERREKIWRNDFEKPTLTEMDLAALRREEKDKEKKAELTKKLKEEERKRAAMKKVAKDSYMELSKLRTVVKNRLEDCEGAAYINYGSRDQLLAALQMMPGMKNLSNTQDDTLLRFNDRPLIQTLRKYNKGKKDTGTYGMQWTQRWITKPLSKEGWRHPITGRLHCIFNQLEAETGRSSSSKPNAQNLPKDDEVRACFICDPPNPLIRVSVCCDSDTLFNNGTYVCTKCCNVCETKDEEYCIVTCDMSGAELRIIAELAQAETWIKAFAMGWDVHSVSTEILEPVKWPQLKEDGCKYYELDAEGQPKRLKCSCKGHGELRQKTKSINFLLCYGGGPAALADELGITVDAAKALMRQHEAAFPDVWGYLERSGKLAKELGEARDMYGRRRSFPDPTEERARIWFIDEHEEELRLPEADCAANLDLFMKRELRKPTKDEKYDLTHRQPTAREVGKGMWALAGSVERRGKNHCIQGTNASMIKRAMGSGLDKDGKPYLWHTLPKFRAMLINMVHDELIVQCPKRFGTQVAELIAGAFKRAAAEVMKRVVMEADYHIANRWMK